jgi:hypothetical protein
MSADKYYTLAEGQSSLFKNTLLELDVLIERKGAPSQAAAPLC